MAGHQGKFVWHDIMTTDVAAATAFYARVVGWKAADSGLPGVAYTLLQAGATPIGGVMAIPGEAAASGAKPRWTGYIAVDDVDAFAAKVKAAGGTLHRPPDDIPGVGRFAVVADPHGASFFLFKGDGEAPPAAAPGTRGHVGWNELHAGHGKEAFDWYSGLFGWTKDQAIDMGPMGVYQTFSTTAGAPADGGMMTKMAHEPVPFWLFYFTVEAVDAAAARASEAGGKVVREPVQVPGGQWIVHCTDPQGALFAMVAPTR